MFEFKARYQLNKRFIILKTEEAYGARNIVSN